MDAKIGLIYNPYSAGNRGDSNLKEKLPVILGSTGEFVVTWSHKDLHSALSRFKQGQIETLAICGGDGTLCYTLSELIKVYDQSPLPNIAFLKSGKMNTIAGSFGISSPATTFLQKIINNYKLGQQSKTVEHSLIKINDHFGFIWGSGVICNYLEEYQKTSTGLIPACKIAMHLFASIAINGHYSKKLWPVFGANITIDGAKQEQKKWINLGASTVKEIGLGFKPFHQLTKGSHTESFHLLSIPPLKHKLTSSLHLLIGNPTKISGLVDKLANEVQIEFEEPQRFIIDGDLFEPAKEVNLSLGPQIRIITP